MADFDINQHLMQMRFGQGAAGGGGDSGTGEAMTPETLIQKGVTQTIQTWFCKILGVGINPDIEGRSALSGFDPQSVGSGFSLSNAPILRDLRGGMLASVLSYFTREFSHLLGSDANGGSGGGGDATASAGGSGGDAGGSGGGDTASAQSGGGDFPMQMPGASAGAADPEMRVDYGGRTISADALVADLGNLRPTPTPVSSSMERDTGMSMS